MIERFEKQGFLIEIIVLKIFYFTSEDELIIS
jgi:hypothetical protein